MHLTPDGLSKRDLIKKHVYAFNLAVEKKVSARDLLGFYETIEAVNSSCSETLLEFQQSSNYII